MQDVLGFARQALREVLHRFKISYVITESLKAERRLLRSVFVWRGVSYSKPFGLSFSGFGLSEDESFRVRVA